jgi:hypothetical protein
MTTYTLDFTNTCDRDESEYEWENNCEALGIYVDAVSKHGKLHCIGTDLGWQNRSGTLDIVLKSETDLGRGMELLNALCKASDFRCIVEYTPRHKTINIRFYHHDSPYTPDNIRIVNARRAVIAKRKRR